MNKKNIQDGIFQVFSEIGNVMAILRLIDNCLLYQFVPYSQFNLSEEFVKQMSKMIIAFEGDKRPLSDVYTVSTCRWMAVCMKLKLNSPYHHGNRPLSQFTLTSPKD